MGFWIFIGLVVLATTVEESVQKYIRAKLLQTALEKGQDLDPKILDQLISGTASSEQVSGPKDPRSVRVAAVVVTFIGLGLGILALALRQIHIDYFWTCLGLGGLTLVTSVGIFIASRMMAAHRLADSSSHYS